MIPQSLPKVWWEKCLTILLGALLYAYFIVMFAGIVVTVFGIAVFPWEPFR